ncbi:MAG: hypothetical protein ABSG92_04350 [Conexivisphaerales archaeon]|jgi:hypothetical protein
MSNERDPSFKRAVTLLISALHIEGPLGDLALAQLILIGGRCRSYVVSFLEEELSLREDYRRLYDELAKSGGVVSPMDRKLLAELVAKHGFVGEDGTQKPFTPADLELHGKELLGGYDYAHQPRGYLTAVQRCCDLLGLLGYPETAGVLKRVASAFGDAVPQAPQAIERLKLRGTRTL